MQTPKTDQLRILLFGASGMVGQGVLRECLLDTAVKEVVCVGREPLKEQHPKLKQIVIKDLFRLADQSQEFEGFDGCFFTIGISAAGLTEAEYARVNLDLPESIGELLSRLNPQMSFVYVSGAGCDSSEKGSVMWARVKGKTENRLLRLPFRRAYMFRPAIVVPKNGESSKTPLYNYFYIFLRPFFGLLEKLPGGVVATTEDIGRSFLLLVKSATNSRVVESSELRALGRQAPFNEVKLNI